MNNINRLITLWMGECWHEADPHNPDECLRCKSAFQDKDGEPYDCESANPDFSLPDHFARLTKRLFEQEKMWEAFHEYAEFNYGQQMYRLQFDTWLLSPDDQFRYTRFVTLFAEFLRLPETRREFGWEECTSDNRSNDCMQDRDECRLQMGKMGSSTGKTCLGKVLSDWAREEEGKDA